uniref:Uncharacterized protein n=1 Tax=Triticum urartu TaxID=4572 RepID=A0A8R7UB60_TRIUA
MEAALLEAGARGVCGGGHQQAQPVLLADERRREPLQHGAVGLGGPCHLELGPEVDVHQHALAVAALRAGGEEDVHVGVLAGGVGRRLVPAGEAERGVVAHGAEGRREEAEEVALARPRRAVALHERGHVGEQVALPETGAVDEALKAHTEKWKRTVSSVRALVPGVIDGDKRPAGDEAKTIMKKKSALGRRHAHYLP